MLAAATAVHVWWWSRTWFKDDDFNYLVTAASSDFDVGYLFTRHDGHFMPGSLALVWLLHAVFGAVWWPVVLCSAVLFLAAGCVLWKLLVSLCGPRPGLLVLFLVAVLSPLAVDTSMWWAAGMQFLPLELGLLLVLWLVHRALRTRRPLDAYWPALVLVGAALFSEKAAFIAPFILGLVAAVPLAEGAGHTVKQRLRAGARVLLLVVAAGVLQVAVYALAPMNHDSMPPFTFDQLRGATWNLIAHTYLPSLFGGPWTWRPASAYLAVAQPTSTAVAVSVLLFAGVVLVSVARRRRVLRLWVILVGYLTAATVALGIGRVGYLGPVTGKFGRYIADAVVPTVVIAALALFGNLFEPDTRRSWVLAFRPRRWSARLVGGATVLACVALAVSATVTNVRLIRYVSRAPARPFVDQAWRSAAVLPQPVELLEQTVPPEVLSPLLYPDNITRTVLAPFHRSLHFVSAAERPTIVRDDGTIVAAQVAGIDVYTPQGRYCLARAVRWAPARATITPPVFSWRWAVTVEYYTEDPGLLLVSLGGDRAEMPVRPGSNKATLIVSGEGDTMTFEVLGGPVCVQRISIGNLVEAAP
jgi:hypothetical protein